MLKQGEATGQRQSKSMQKEKEGERTSMEGNVIGAVTFSEKRSRIPQCVLQELFG
jgi:hypothetical protein